jgi:hypothetical protein
VSKETYYSVKRDLLDSCLIGPSAGKESIMILYTSVKRDLHECQKRPTRVSKETYTSVSVPVYFLYKVPV